MAILIAGATGFIGSHLVGAGAARGHEVIALSRSGRHVRGAAKSFQWSFGHPIPAAACDGVACAINLAHDFSGVDGAGRTLEGTIAMARQLRASGVKRQIFFSSYSAGQHANSIYGKTKFAVENELASIEGMIIVRPGLVIGEGGIYGRIRKFAHKYPIIPLPDGGKGKIPVIGIEYLCGQTMKLVNEPTPPKEVNLFERDLKSLRQLVLESAGELGRRPVIVAVPSRIVMVALTLAEWLSLPLPVNKDSLIGFTSNREARHVPTAGYLKP